MSPEGRTPEEQLLHDIFGKQPEPPKPGWLQIALQIAVLTVLTDAAEPLTRSEVRDAINARPELLPPDFTLGLGGCGAALDIAYRQGRCAHWWPSEADRLAYEEWRNDPDRPIYAPVQRRWTL